MRVSPVTAGVNGADGFVENPVKFVMLPPVRKNSKVWFESRCTFGNPVAEMLSCGHAASRYSSSGSFPLYLGFK